MSSVPSEGIYCPVCFKPFKPPIFQCPVGHPLCSECRDNLSSRNAFQCITCNRRCVYERNYNLEHIVDSFYVACENAPYGCNARPLLHSLEEHLEACPHVAWHCPREGCGYTGSKAVLDEHLWACPYTQCHCPGEACSFVGPPAHLVDHFSRRHSWPCKTVRAGEASSLHLNKGFNVVSTGTDLLLLDVANHMFCRSIYVVGVRGSRPASDTPRNAKLQLSYPSFADDNEESWESTIVWSDLSAGLPDSEDRYIVPKYAVGEDDDLIVKVVILIT